MRGDAEELRHGSKLPELFVNRNKTSKKFRTCWNLLVLDLRGSKAEGGAKRSGSILEPSRLD